MVPPALLKAFHQTPAIDRLSRFPVFMQGEASLGVWLVESGRLIISRISSRGRSVILAVLEAGELAGLGSALTGLPCEVGSETAESCRLRLLPRADLLRLIKHDADCYASIAWLLATELGAAQRWIGDIILSRFSSVRLAKLLLHCSEQELARMTHTHLAERIGVTRESVTRMIQILKSSGALTPERGPISILDRELLKKLAM